MQESTHPFREGSSDYERVGRFIYAFHRVFITVGGFSGSELNTTVPQDVRARAAALADRFEFVVTNYATVTDAEMVRTLDEAIEVEVLIKQSHLATDSLS